MSELRQSIIKYIAVDFDILALDRFIRSRANVSDLINQHYVNNRDVFTSFDMFNLSGDDMLIVIDELSRKIEHLVGITFDNDVCFLLSENMPLPYKNFNDFAFNKEERRK